MKLKAGHADDSLGVDDVLAFAMQGAARAGSAAQVPA
jgi:hypothetical protein